jgi:hypothetical protein
MGHADAGALADVLRDLHTIFADRLESYVAYGDGAVAATSLALVSSLTSNDLTACAGRASRWHRAGAATPLLLTRAEFTGSLDAFPLEYGEIIDAHRVLHGADPFAGLSIDPTDLRRACEVQAKSHLLHLRENYVERGARPAAVHALVAESAPAFRTLLRRLARLDGHASATDADLGRFAGARCGLDARVVGDVLALARDAGAAVDAARLFPAYLAAAERLSQFADRWNADGRG